MSGEKNNISVFYTYLVQTLQGRRKLHKALWASSNVGETIYSSGWYRVNWSAKFWVDNCPLCPLISYSPECAYYSLLIIITFSHLNNRLWPAEVMKPLWWCLLTKNSSRNWNFPFLPIRTMSKSKTKWLLLTKVLVSSLIVGFGHVSKKQNSVLQFHF